MGRRLSCLVTIPASRLFQNFRKDGGNQAVAVNLYRRLCKDRRGRIVIASRVMQRMSRS